MLLTGIAVFAGGFAIWNIDNIFCDQLRQIRDFLGLYLGMIVQGHGFWHLMTGYGSYLIFVSANCESLEPRELWSFELEMVEMDYSLSMLFLPDE
jgi:hypothetical protein